MASRARREEELFHMDTRRARWICLNLIPDVAPTHWRRCLEAFGGDLDRLWDADAEALQRVVSPRIAQRIVEGRRQPARLERELALAARLGVRLVTRDDAEYSAALHTIPDPPLALYVRGALTAADGVAVAIVGARHASAYGLACADQLSYDVALRGITVVSGLARGIDAAAHAGALKASGRTLAVLGGGVARLYPPEHVALAERIAQQGAVLSEYPLQTPPLPEYFPRRNRIISGLSLGVVVVEASQRSGALITADCALEQGREVFAVPGPMTAVTSQGTHHLVKQGARLVTSVEDIVEELGLVAAHPAARGTSSPPHLAAGPPARLAAPAPRPSSDARGPGSDRARRVLACLREDDPVHIDAIAAASGCAMPDVSSILLELELRQVIRQLPGKQFVRQ